MTKIEQTYIDILRQSVYDKISADINEKTIEQIVKTYLYKSHIVNKKSASFQDYYFKTLNNEKLFLNSVDFFRQFKKQYSLQGIDNNYLNRLETNKNEILKLIHANNLANLYFDKFNKAKIKHGDKFIEKDLGSFFSKLVHTFRPDKYCALDNPIKNYFGLTKESFFIAFFIISDVYINWSADNKQLINTIKKKLKQLDKDEIIKYDQLTNLKLLDLIFWGKANRTDKKASR